MKYKTHEDTVKKEIVVKVNLQEGAQIPKRKMEAAAYDCYANEDIEIGDDAVLIKLGFKLELPEGYYAEIVPRSSTGLKTPLRQANCVGIIDNDYRGEVRGMFERKQDFGKGFLGRLKWLLFGTPKYKINKGDRICQLLIKKDLKTAIQVEEKLTPTERGEKGFGSTGK